MNHDGRIIFRLPKSAQYKLMAYCHLNKMPISRLMRQLAINFAQEYCGWSEDDIEKEETEKERREREIEHFMRSM